VHLFGALDQDHSGLAAEHAVNGIGEMWTHRPNSSGFKRSADLSITYKLDSDHDARFDVGQPRLASPYERNCQEE